MSRRECGAWRLPDSPGCRKASCYLCNLPRLRRPDDSAIPRRAGLRPLPAPSVAPCLASRGHLGRPLAGHLLPPPPPHLPQGVVGLRPRHGLPRSMVHDPIRSSKGLSLKEAKARAVEREAEHAREAAEQGAPEVGHNVSAVGEGVRRLECQPPPLELPCPYDRAPLWTRHFPARLTERRMRSHSMRGTRHRLLGPCCRDP